VKAVDLGQEVRLLRFKVRVYEAALWKRLERKGMPASKIPIAIAGAFREAERELAVRGGPSDRCGVCVHYRGLGSCRGPSWAAMVPRDGSGTCPKHHLLRSPGSYAARKRHRTNGARRAGVWPLEAEGRCYSVTTQEAFQQLHDAVRKLGKAFVAERPLNHAWVWTHWLARRFSDVCERLIGKS